MHRSATVSVKSKLDHHFEAYFSAVRPTAAMRTAAIISPIDVFRPIEPSSDTIVCSMGTIKGSLADS